MHLLSPVSWKSTRKYRAVTTGDLVLDLCMGFKGTHFFYCGETLLGMIVDDILTIFAGYASDLCSPGFYLLGMWVGTYSRGMELEAFLHDFLRQFLIPCAPWDRKITDTLFYNAGRMRGHGIRIKIYHGAVSGKLGDAWMWLNKSRPDVYCRSHELTNTAPIK